MNKLIILSIAIIVAIFTSEFFKSEQFNIDVNSLTGEYQQNNTVGSFNGQEVTSNKLAETKFNKKVLGANDGNKRIEVDLTNQRLYAYEGDKLIYNFLISSGKWGKHQLEPLEFGVNLDI